MPSDLQFVRQLETNNFSPWSAVNQFKTRELPNINLGTLTGDILRKRFPFRATSDIKYKSKYMAGTCLNVCVLTYWSGPGSQGSGAWSFMWGDYNKNWASISLPKPRGAQWLSGLFSLTGRWKWELVFGHASLRENLDWDINKGLKSEGNLSFVISQRAIHISHSFCCLFHFHKTPSHSYP